MCRVCDWGRHLRLAGSLLGDQGGNSPTPAGPAPSRRSLLRATAGFAGAATALGTLSSSARAQLNSPPGANEADFVFSGGRVFTADSAHPWAEAVAVRGNRILYVGNATGVEPYLAPSTRVVDLKGKLLLPGFVEGHIHPIVGAALTHGVDLQYDTREETLKVLAAWRDRAGKVPVVRGFGWRYGAFPASGPVKADLDKLWPDTPVMLIAVDGHSAWVNSTALKMARVTAETPDPLPGFSIFQRDAKTGEPTGWLIEVPAVIRVMQAAAPITVEFISTALEAWMAQAAAAGITSLFDAGMQVVEDEVGLRLYEDLERAKKLPFRVIASYYHNDPEVDPMPHVRRLRDRARTELVHARILKLNIDGVDAQYTAAMLDPYSDRPGTRGNTILNPALARDLVIRADAEGFDVHFHAIGDRAVRLALDAVEAAIKANGQRDRRHAIAHMGLIADDDLPRFVDLGVIAQFSAQWAVPDRYWTNVTSVRWGQARAARTYRFGSVLRSKAAVSFGTDWPAAAHRSTFQPLDGIEAAVTRCELGKGDQTPLSPAQERITLEEAVRANTIAAARQLRLDDKVGSLASGKRADLVVLDRDIFKMPPEEIHTARVLLTMMNGVIRHEVKG